MSVDVALDVRETSHMSAGMLSYVRALRRRLPAVAADLRLAEIGSGDNFDLAEQLGLPLAVARVRPRLVHIPTPFVPRVIPAPYVVTVHDVIDLEFPQYGKAKVVPYWRFVVAPVLRAARAVITDDDATVALLQRYAGVDPKRVRVVPLGVDAPPDVVPIERPRPYFVYAGNRRPHKDVPLLVRAWAELPPRYEVDLVLTGPPDPLLAAQRARGEVVFTGDASESELWRWYAGAAACVQPARREGFGLPALEALRVGTPAIASDAAAPRVLRPFVALFPAGDGAALGALLAQALDDAAGWRERAREARAATAPLTWDRTVRETARVYRELLG